ncbi:MAG: transcriptional repressor [Saprospiraceae bacterium]|nr:transcriptional repressor [Saprospiraceae bacterium]
MEDKILEMLQKADLRVTRSRKEVLDIFCQSGDQAISSSDIEHNITGIDRITLYRILKTFEESGLVHSVADGSGKTKYALCSHECSGGNHHDNHLHFYCRVCDTTTCMDHVKLPAVRLPQDYQVEEMRFVVAGVCKDCH